MPFVAVDTVMKKIKNAPPLKGAIVTNAYTLLVPLAITFEKQCTKQILMGNKT